MNNSNEHLALIVYEDASFAENFYGMKRRRRPLFETERARAVVGGLPVEERLRSREVWRSLLFLVRASYTLSANISVWSQCQIPHRLVFHIYEQKLRITTNNHR